MNDSWVEDPADAKDASLDAPTVALNASSAASQTTGVDALPSRDTVFPSQAQFIDEYEVVDEIARGSMGVVYKAKHAELDRSVALKMILDSEGQTELSRKRFANEARAAASLDHPGIVPVYDVGSHEGRPYFTMAYVAGNSLAALLANGPLSARRSAEIAMQIAQAAAHAHRHGIIHRDLKPANVLIDDQGMPHVTDFGVSKSLAANCDLTCSGEVVGTPHYMPPEQAGGQGGGQGGEIQPAADVYSIGAILYAMLTGRPPFQAATPIEVISQVLTQTPVPTRTLIPSVPVDLEVITLKCLSKSIRDRYASADRLSEDLERYLRGEPILAKPPGLIRKSLFFVRRHVVWASVSGTASLALVLLTAVVAGAYLRARSQISDLEDNLVIAQQQVTSERALLKRYLNRVGDEQNDPFDTTRLELDRITNAFEMMLAAGKNDLALELAVESVQFAIRNSIPVPASSLEHLRSSISNQDPASSSDPASADPASAKRDAKTFGAEAFDLETLEVSRIQEMVDQARASIVNPMTPTQRNIFGISRDRAEESSDETLIPNDSATPGEAT